MTEQSNPNRAVLAVIMLLAVIGMEFLLYAEDQNEYPGALTAVLLATAAMLYIANLQRR